MSAEQDREFTDYVVGRRDALRRSAYLLCRDAHAADDLVQTAVTKLYLAWSRARGADSLDAYAHTVLVRVFLDEQRRGWWKVRLTDRSPEVRQPRADVEGGLDVRAALGTLTPHQRAVLVLRYVQDLSIEQAAAALGCSTGTVKSQTSRALAALRRALHDDDTAGTGAGGGPGSDTNRAGRGGPDRHPAGGAHGSDAGRDAAGGGRERTALTRARRGPAGRS